MLLLVLALAACYFILIDGGDTFLGRPGWTTVTVVNLAAWVCYSLILWVNRQRLVQLDYHMLYLPGAVWFVVDLAGRLLMPFVVRAVSGSTGGTQKGLINAFFEAAVVAMLYGVYLVRFVRTDAGPRESAFLARVVIICAAAVAILVPSLGE